MKNSTAYWKLKDYMKFQERRLLTGAFPRVAGVCVCVCIYVYVC